MFPRLRYISSYLIFFSRNDLKSFGDVGFYKTNELAIRKRRASEELRIRVFGLDPIFLKDPGI